MGLPTEPRPCSLCGVVSQRKLHNNSLVNGFRGQPGLGRRNPVMPSSSCPGAPDPGRAGRISFLPNSPGGRCARSRRLSSRPPGPPAGPPLTRPAGPATLRSSGRSSGGGRARASPGRAPSSTPFNRAGGVPRSDGGRGRPGPAALRGAPAPPSSLPPRPAGCPIRCLTTASS